MSMTVRTRWSMRSMRTPEPSELNPRDLTVEHPLMLVMHGARSQEERFDDSRGIRPADERRDTVCVRHRIDVPGTEAGVLSLARDGRAGHSRRAGRPYRHQRAAGTRVARAAGRHRVVDGDE